MFAEYFRAGGPIMYAVFAAWVVVLAAVLDRALYAVGRILRRPLGKVDRLLEGRRFYDARVIFLHERELAGRGLARIDAVSQIATSIGLFGTVLGIARSFFARGVGAGVAAPEVLASGLSTALFTTIAGLVVFLLGQAFLIGYREWLAFDERNLSERLELEDVR